MMIPNTTIPDSGVVIEGKIYRGQQPTTSQFAELAALGIRFDIDLRNANSREWETEACEALGIEHVNIPIGAGLFGIDLVDTAPTADELSKVRPYLQSPRGPVFVHCEHGHDRTGAIIACLVRIEMQGWTNEAALAEALSYGMTEGVMKEFVANYKPCGVYKGLAKA
jgi:protein tyrosine/serine phosphatase